MLPEHKDYIIVKTLYLYFLLLKNCLQYHKFTTTTYQLKTVLVFKSILNQHYT